MVHLLKIPLLNGILSLQIVLTKNLYMKLRIIDYFHTFISIETLMHMSQAFKQKGQTETKIGKDKKHINGNICLLHSLVRDQAALLLF